MNLFSGQIAIEQIALRIALYAIEEIDEEEDLDLGLERLSLNEGIMDVSTDNESTDAKSVSDDMDVDDNDVDDKSVGCSMDEDEDDYSNQPARKKRCF